MNNSNKKIPSPEKLKFPFYKKSNDLLKSFESSSISFINYKLVKIKQYNGPVDIRYIFYEDLSKISENIEKYFNKNKINYSKIINVNIIILKMVIYFLLKYFTFLKTVILLVLYQNKEI